MFRKVKDTAARKLVPSPEPRKLPAPTCDSGPIERLRRRLRESCTRIKLENDRGEGERKKTTRRTHATQASSTINYH